MAETDTPETLDPQSSQRLVKRGAVPGLVIIFSGRAPMMRPLPLGAGPLQLGRHDPTGATLPDERLSREHAVVTFDSERWSVRDLDSRNGTFVDGERVHGSVTAAAPRIFRLGHTLYLPVLDTRSLTEGGVITGGDKVVGPTLQRTLHAVRDAAAADRNLLVRGESGSGKELVARTFHGAGPRATGPFVAVNCATIPEGLAERLLFGARRGAYSGATDQDGFVQAADRGILFLDEIGELDMGVQAKLLRVLEGGEVIPLGATAARRVDVRFCFATNRDLRAAVGAGRFRADLFYRIAQPWVVVPALRDRLEEIPWLVAHVIGRADGELAPHARLIEACLLRPWPGNVRELFGAVGDAVRRARAAGAGRVGLEHLDALAGEPLQRSSSSSSVRRRRRPDREAVERALRESEGNVTAAARALGLHRQQLYRLIERFGIALRKP